MMASCAEFWDYGDMAELLGYARVSTQRQSLDQQLDALTTAGVDPDRVYVDKMSGARDDREGLAALLAYARPGDTVVVIALDRLGRSLSHIVRTVADLTERGIVLRSLRESIDTSTSVGNMLVGIFGALAEYERNLINERAQSARDAASARGKHIGRPRALTDDQAAMARRMRQAGESVEDIRRALGVGRSTLYRLLADEPAGKA